MAGVDVLDLMASHVRTIFGNIVERCIEKLFLSRLQRDLQRVVLLPLPHRGKNQNANTLPQNLERFHNPIPLSNHIMVDVIDVVLLGRL